MQQYLQLKKKMVGKQTSAELFVSKYLDWIRLFAKCKYPRKKIFWQFWPDSFVVRNSYFSFSSFLQLLGAIAKAELWFVRNSILFRSRESFAYIFCNHKSEILRLLLELQSSVIRSGHTNTKKNLDFPLKWAPMSQGSCCASIDMCTV